MVKEQLPWEYQRAPIIMAAIYCVKPGEGEKNLWGGDGGETGVIRERGSGRMGSRHVKWCKYREKERPEKWKVAKHG